MANLNKEQERAVLHLYGPCLVLAGPGSGKTHTLVERIRHMIEDEGISANEILVITFSKKAAMEMQERFNCLTHNKSYSVYFGTFHAVFYSILMKHTSINRESVLTEQLKIQYIERVLRKNGIEKEDKNNIYHISNLISKYKSTEGKDDCNYYDEEFLNIYQSYVELCKKENRIDFDDMQYLCMDLLENNPNICMFYHKIYKYILVDEYQDINDIQYKIIKILAGSSRNIFAVGDDDQSIYGFRGAKPELMKRFLEDNKDAEIINLSRNYRSTRAIIEMAGKLIQNNNSRIAKTQIPTKDENETGIVKVKICKNGKEEADYVCETISNIMKSGDSLSNIAIIYRTAKCIDIILEKMNYMGIPYEINQVVDNYYNTEWMKDIVAYLRVGLGDASHKYLFRILNKPERGLSREYIIDNDGLHKSEDCEYALFLNKIKSLSKMSCFAAVNYILKGLEYEKYLYNILTKKGYSLDEIKDIIDEILSRSKMYLNVRDWIYYIDSVSNISADENDVGKEKATGKVNMLTAHASKGLEFDSVFVVGLQEDIFPHRKASSETLIEEERRLLYVAMTRAKRNLYIIGRGENQYGKKVSRFIEELTKT